MRTIVFFGLSLVLIPFTACVGDNNPTGSDGGDAATPDASGDVALGNDATPDAPTDAGDGAIATTYLDVGDAANWSEYVLSDPSAYGSSGTTGFIVGVLANDAVFFFPSCCGYGNGTAFRLDTTAAFTAKTSWTPYYMSPLVANTGVTGTVAAAFDGTYVLVFGEKKLAARYDTTKPVGLDSSWTTFDLSATYGGGLESIAYAKQKAFVTSFSGTVGTIVRYDDTQSFTNASSWSAFDPSQTNTALRYLVTAGSDGKYVYVSQGFSSPGEIVAQYDPTTTFTDPSRWVTFDTSQVLANAKGNSGAIFDGRYMYFPPMSTNAPTGATVRYDTTKPFTQASSWEGFDLATLGAEVVTYAGGTFDGRYVYFSPHNATATLVRFDTTKPFAQASSWQKIAMSTATTKTTNQAVYSGAVFDGEYVYFVPQATLASVALSAVSIPRFHARTPRSPLGFVPSFR